MSPSYGLMHYKIIFGSFKSASFCEFLNELFDKCDVFRLITHNLVMDNARIHKTPEVRELIAAGVNQRNANRPVLQKQILLPPYSPHLNPIEEMWSVYKSYIKREEKTDRPGLVALMQDATDEIKQADCDGFYRHTVRYYTQCIDKQPL
jgi:transposase